MLGTLENVLSIDCQICHPLFWPLAQNCDVLVLPFFSGWDFFDLIERRRATGKVTVFETNDCYHEPQPWNPIAEHWTDPGVTDEHARLVSAVDGIQVSSKAVGDLWKNSARNIAVFDNHLTDLPELPEIPERPFTIGFGGSQGHLADLYDISSLLQLWLDSRPNTKLAIMCHASAQEFFSLPPERFSFTQAGTLEEYFRFISTLDVGVAPLLPSEWNRCRSDVKFIEYASRGVVGAYSGYGPYNQSVKDRDTGFIFNSRDELQAILDELYADHELRKNVRSNAYKYVKSNRMLSEHIRERVEYYSKLGARDSDTQALRSQLEPHARCLGNYLRLEHSNETKLLINAISAKPSAEAVQALATLTNKYPQHFLAHRALGSMLNSVGEAKNAVNVLQRAVSLHPGSSMALAELGRSFLLIKEGQRGFEFLCRAIDAVPFSEHAWRYLIQFLRRNQQIERAPFLEKLRSAKGRNYRLLLLGAELLEGRDRVAIVTEALQLACEKLTTHELDFAAPYFSRACQTLLPPCFAVPECLELLDKLTSAFPRSVMLLTLSAKAHREHRRFFDAQKLLIRAAEIENTGREYSRELSQGGSDNLYPALVSHIAKSRL